MPKYKNFILISMLLFVGCSNVSEVEDKSEKNEIFDGMYEVKQEDTDMTNIWVFSDHLKYSFRAVQENRISYEVPLNFYTIGNGLYICPVNLEMQAITLEECRAMKGEPDYQILKVDTIKVYNSPKIVYTLKQVITDRILKLTKID